MSLSASSYGSDGMRLPTIITSIVIINELPPKTTRNQLNIYPMPTFKQQAATERDMHGMGHSVSSQQQAFVHFLMSRSSSRVVWGGTGAGQYPPTTKHGAALPGLINGTNRHAES